MSREITQTTAWVIAVLLSMVLFGGIIGGIIYLVPNDRLLRKEVRQTTDSQYNASDQFIDSKESTSSETTSNENVIRADDPEYLPETTLEPSESQPLNSEGEIRSEE